MRVTLCERCGAPLQGEWTVIAVVCAFCGATNLPGGQPVPLAVPDDGRVRLGIGGRTYVVVRRLATGQSTDVFEGRWVNRLGERVVLKILRDDADERRVRNDVEVLSALRRSTVQGASRLCRRLPQPIALGRAPVPVTPGSERTRDRLVAVFQWNPGFTYNLVDVKERFPEGVDPRAGVWIGKRLLEILAFVHSAGVVHRAVIPPHVLVKGGDHGAMLVGFATAGPPSEPLPAVAAEWSAWYRHEPGELSLPADDVAMVALAIREVCAPLPPGMAALVEEAAAGGFSSAWALRERLDAEAAAAFGPPGYHPLPL